MNLLENIIEKKKELYNLAREYYQNINVEEYENAEFNIISKSISIVFDHDFLPTRCLEIKLELRLEDDINKIGNYFLYINEHKEFVDEFLMLK